MTEKRDIKWWSITLGFVVGTLFGLIASHVH